MSAMKVEESDIHLLQILNLPLLQHEDRQHSQEVGGVL